MNRLICTKRPFFSILPLFALLLCTLVLFPPPAAAQDESRITLTVEAGFDGFYKATEAMPVYVTVSNAGTAVDGELRITLNVGYGEKLTYRTPVTLATQSNKRIAMPVQMVTAANSISVELWEGNALVALQASGTVNRMDDDTFLYGVVTSDVGSFDILSGATGRYPRAEVAYLTMDDLPEIAPVWDGLDMLILDDVDSALLSVEQRAGLNSWLENGGQLLITGGAGWQKTTAVFADILPVRVNGVQSVDDLPALSTYFDKKFRDDGPYLLTDSVLTTGGELLVYQDGQPILARRPIGDGNIYFLALDPKSAPLLDWSGTPLLWELMLDDLPAAPHLWNDGIQQPYEAESAIAILPSLALPSTLLLAFFLLSYLIVIGPLNYIILRRRDALARAWITIPVISLVFTLIASLIGFQLKGNDNIINELSVATGRMGTETMRVESVIGLYSPRRTDHNLLFPYNSIAVPFDGNGGFTAGNLEAIGRESSLTMEGVRVDVGGMETFLADSYQPMPALSGQATLSVVDGAAQLMVDIENDSGIVFEEMALLVGSRAYVLQDFGENGRLSFTHDYTTAPSALRVFAPFNATSSTSLLGNSEQILRTANYYEDSTTFARYRLLGAIQPLEDYSATVSYRYRTDVVTLLAWADESQLNVELEGKAANQYHTTLYLIDIPLIYSGLSDAK